MAIVTSLVMFLIIIYVCIIIYLFIKNLNPDFYSFIKNLNPDSNSNKLTNIKIEFDVQLRSKDIEIQNLQDKLAQTKKFNNELIKSKDTEIQNLKEQLAQTNHSMDLLQNRFNRKEDSIRSKDTEIQDLKKQLTTAQQRADDVQSRNKKLWDDSNKTIMSKNTEIRNLKDKLVETQHLKEQFALEEEIRKIEKQLSKKDTKIQNLKEQLTTAQQLKKESESKVKEYSKEIRKIEKQLSEKNTEIQDLQEQLSETQQLNSNNELIKSKDTEIQDLKDQLKEQKKNLNKTHKTAIKKLQDKNADIENKLQQEQDAHKKSISDIKALEEQQFFDEEIEKRFHEMLNNAKQEIFIISPWVGRTVTNKVLPILEEAASKGVRIHIVYGIKKDEEKSEESEQQIKRYKRKLGNSLTITKDNTHIKVCICDDNEYLIGSFNFLSNYYYKDNDYKEKYLNSWHELCYYGQNAKKLKELKQKCLNVEWNDTSNEKENYRFSNQELAEYYGYFGNDYDNFLDNL